LDFLLPKIFASDKWRKKHGLNVVFVMPNKKPHCKWKKYASTPQENRDIQRLWTSKDTAYAYVCGYNGLVGIDFDLPIFYHLCKAKFGERFNTFTVQTPNRGYHVYFISKNTKIDRPDQFKDIGVEFKGEGSYIITHGKVRNDKNELGEYKVVVDEDIREDDDIIEDVRRFIGSIEDKFSFLRYKCIQSLLSSPEKHGPSHEQRLALSNFLVRTNEDVEVLSKFFELCWDYNQKYTITQLKSTIERIEGGELKPPRCETLRGHFNFKEGMCRGCLRRQEREEDKTPSIEDIVERDISALEDRLLAPRMGQSYTKEYGLMFSKLSEDKGSVIGVSNPNVVFGYHPKLHTKSPKGVSFTGYPGMIPEYTQKAILLVAKDVLENRLNPPTISEAYSIIKGYIDKYLSFVHPGQAKLLALWIMGTYMIQLFTWYPYIGLVGARDVGKSTTLNLLALTCYGGSPDVASERSKAEITRLASACHGLLIVDHFEAIISKEETRKTYEGILEAAWFRDATRKLVDKETLEPESLDIYSSIAIAGRYLTESVREKGIEITMIKDTNPELVRNSAKMADELDPIENQRMMIGVALRNYKRVKEAYDNIPHIRELGARPFNLFRPLLAMAKVIDEETDGTLYKDIESYAKDYVREQKLMHPDREEDLLRGILIDKLWEGTFSDFSRMMEKQGYSPHYHHRTAAADLHKLQVIKTVRRDRTPVRVTLDKRKVIRRAYDRGIDIEKLGYSLRDLDKNEDDQEPLTGEKEEKEEAEKEEKEKEDVDIFKEWENDENEDDYPWWPS